MNDCLTPTRKARPLTSLGTAVHFYTELEERDMQLLRHLGNISQSKTCREALWTAQEAIDHLYVLEQGWAYSYRDMQGDCRRIIDVFLPGDILGLRGFTFKAHGTHAAMLTHGRVASFSLHALIDLVQASPRLTTALLAATSRQGARLIARTQANQHPDPNVRLAHFVSEIHLRVAEPGERHATHFYFPPSSSMLGSLLNLSSEQVESAFSALEAADIVKKYRHHIEILDKQRLFHAAQLDITDDFLA